MKRIVFLFLFAILSASSVFPQMEKQAAQELQKRNIHSKEEIDAELRSMNMTESDARRLAQQYGMDYDDFVSEYVMKNKSETKPVPASTTSIAEAPKQESITITTPDAKISIPSEQTQAVQAVVIPQTGDDKPSKYFGYDIFSNIPKAFEPAAVGPVDPGYILGPGDELRLVIWGDVEFTYTLTVDQSGNVFIPTAGQVFVLGVQYSDLQKKMVSYLSRFYEGLAANPATVFLDISISKLRPIKIFALGDVSRPGGYEVSSFSTVFNALYSVGGPLETGSLREVRVLRDNKIVSKIDLYDYLLKGQIANDMRLRNNDVIFIPPRLKTVSIKGEVLRTYIYEIKDGEGIKELISFAGGLKSTAYVERIQVKRIIPFEKRQNESWDREVIDVNLKAILTGTAANFPLFDGDEITVFPILDKMENFVKIGGAVYRPGMFEIKDGKTIKDVIKEAYGLLPEAYLEKADLTRTLPNEKKEFYSFHLSEAMNGNPVHNFRLLPRDEIRIYSIYEIEGKHNVSIEGYVKENTTVEYADSLTLYDMIFKAGGLQDPYFKSKALSVRGDIIRINQDKITTRIISFDLDEVLTRNSGNMDLEPGDKIIIYKADIDRKFDEYVRIEGMVKKPGQYRLSQDMTPVDLILQAGGFKELALKGEVYLNRINPLGYKGEQLSETIQIKIPVTQTLENGSIRIVLDSANTQNQIRLQDKDVLVVRKNPDFENQRRVVISGEVTYPGVYILTSRNQTVMDVLTECGGPTSEGYLFGAQFNRNNKRVVVDLEKVFYDEDYDENIALMDGDSIYVPSKPGSVFVTGEVNNEGLFKYIPGDNVWDYLNRAGDITEDADYAILFRANGMSEKISLGFLGSNPEVKDGAIIKVFKKKPISESEKDSVDISGTIKDVLAVIVSAVTILVLAKQL